MRRRTFLASVVATMAVEPIFAARSMLERSASDVGAIAIGSSPDVERFRRLASWLIGTSVYDVGDALESILYSDSARLPRVLIGLTRESDLQLIEQVARERGYVRTYLCRHEYRDGKLTPAVEGSAALVRHMPALLTAPAVNARGSTAHLLSWCLVKEAAEA